MSLACRTLPVVAVLASLTGPFTSDALAQDERPRHLYFELGAFGGVFVPDEEHEFYDETVAVQEPFKTVSPDMGVHIAFFPLSWLGLEGEGSAVLGKTDSGGTANLFSARGSLVLQIPFRVTPFVLGGIGNTWLVSEDDVLGEDRDRVFHGGAGSRSSRPAASRSASRAASTTPPRARPGQPTEENGYVPHFGGLAGLTWALGGRSSGRDSEGDPDPDLDGFVAPEDKCPDERGVEPDGCPAKDSDNDGLNDSADRCPTEAETVNGHDDTDGCPDDLPDADGDGISPARRQCADEPEERTAFKDATAAPRRTTRRRMADADRHGPEETGPTDNRAARTDKTQTGSSTASTTAPRARAGRATRAAAASSSSRSRRASSSLQERQFRSGGASIARPSRKLLDQVASLIKAHPEFEKVRIEGHTDDRGSDDTTRRVQERAQASRLPDRPRRRPDRLQAEASARRAAVQQQHRAGRRKNPPRRVSTSRRFARRGSSRASRAESGSGSGSSVSKKSGSDRDRDADADADESSDAEESSSSKSPAARRRTPSCGQEGRGQLRAAAPAATRRGVAGRPLPRQARGWPENARQVMVERGPRQPRAGPRP